MLVGLAWCDKDDLVQLINPIDSICPFVKVSLHASYCILATPITVRLTTIFAIVMNFMLSGPVW